jgi:hypothetical protein
MPLSTDGCATRVTVLQTTEVVPLARVIGVSHRDIDAVERQVHNAQQPSKDNNSSYIHKRSTQLTRNAARGQNHINDLRLVLKLELRLVVVVGNSD